MNRTLDSIPTDTILSKKDKKTKKDKKRRKDKKKDKKKKKVAGITININVGGGGGKAKQPKQPRGAKGLVARTTSMRGQQGKGNLDQAARQAEANARAMQGIYGVSTRITETDKRVDDIGDRLTRLGQYFYTNQPAQIQKPPDQKFNVTMNLPDVQRLGGQVQDRFDRLEDGLEGAFVGMHNQNLQTQNLAQRVLDGVNGSNEVGDLFEQEEYDAIETTPAPAPAPAPATTASAALYVADDPDKNERTTLGTEKPTTPPLTSPPTSSSIFEEEGDTPPARGRPEGSTTSTPMSKDNIARTRRMLETIMGDHYKGSENLKDDPRFQTLVDDGANVGSLKNLMTDIFKKNKNIYRQRTESQQMAMRDTVELYNKAVEGRRKREKDNKIKGMNKDKFARTKEKIKKKKEF
jgi:hypothetical protein